MTTKRRSHKNTPRLTAKERARSIRTDAPLTPKQLFALIADIEKALQAHARDAVARYRRKHRPAAEMYLKKMQRSPMFSGLDKKAKR